MSRTGRYKIIDGELVKISDRASIPSHVWFPKDSIHTGGRFEHLREEPFTSRQEKREYMREKGVAEA